MKSYASYFEWKEDQSLENQRLITALERIVEGVAPHWTKTVKWGQGCFAEDGVHKVYIHAADDHVQLGFYAGAKMKDPKRLLVGSGKHVRHVKVRTARDVDAGALAALVTEVRG